MMNLDAVHLEPGVGSVGSGPLSRLAVSPTSSDALGRGLQITCAELRMFAQVFYILPIHSLAFK